MMLRIAAAGAALVTGVFFVIRSLLQRRRKRTLASKMFENLVRLPKFAVPRRYDLELRPDLDTCKFGGKLAVTLNILEDTKYLVLNAADLVIADSSVRFRSTASRKVVNPSNVSIDAKDEILVLEFDETLPREEGILDIEFQGTLNDQMKGFYRSTYVINGEKRNMAVTQFEPADARRCFPCWDEPSYKATFQITVYAPVDRVVLSNMPVFEEKTDGNLKRVSFQESRIMSTYLVAIVVGEFEYIEQTTTAGNKVRVYCQVGKTNQGMFALDVAVRTLPYYAEYFGTPYPLPKLDMVAIPDFCFGAMENYGLVTYRETALLYDEKHSAAANKQRVAIVVTHELAHQWFGNLVTMEWWTHLWLNEGFATWVSYLAADYLFPEWKIWTQFNEETVDAFRLDALVESHPIEVEVGHARELTEIFDAISYKKGASIFRMLESYIGAQVFKKGLNSYIKRYAWKNAKTEDLWAVLSEESREPVNELMDSWTKKSYSTIAWVACVIHGRVEDVSYAYLHETPATTVFRVLNSLGVIGFAYAGHNVALEIQATIPSSTERPSKIPMWRGIMFAYFIVALCYFPIAIVGYWAFGQTVSDNLLLTLKKPDWLIAATNMMVGIHVIGSYQVFAMLVYDGL